MSLRKASRRDKKAATSRPKAITSTLLVRKSPVNGKSSFIEIVEGNFNGHINCDHEPDNIQDAVRLRCLRLCKKTIL